MDNIKCFYVFMFLSMYTTLVYENLFKIFAIVRPNYLLSLPTQQHAKIPGQVYFSLYTECSRICGI